MTGPATLNHMEHANDGRGIVLPAELNGWVERQRWYAGKGHRPVLRSIGFWTLPSAEAGVRIGCHLAVDTAGGQGTLYQIPLTERRSPVPGAAMDALISSAPGADDQPRYLYDAPHDPAYAAALLGFIFAGTGRADTAAAPAATSLGATTAAVSTGPGARPDTVAAHTTATGTTTVVAAPAVIAPTPTMRPVSSSAVTARAELLAPLGHGGTPRVTGSRVLTGEQSNTSIIIDVAESGGESGRPVICKVFRVVANGSNPDVSVQSALARAGSSFVPEPLGAVTGEWTDPATSTRFCGHLAFAQEFLPGVQDAWRVALRAAEAGEDFSDRARALGAATAAVHRDLAGAFPTLEVSPEVVRSVCAGMRERYRQAVREVPELAEHSAAISAVYDLAESAPSVWPRPQRIHGDYHLGQVLNVPGRGWVLIDFEGEPLRPLSERTQPDIPLKDVAGMLRSFDYVGATIARQRPDAEAAALDWVDRARTAFRLGYRGEAGLVAGEQAALLDAFEMDKAVYESVYETRNRPTWVSIPLRAVRRLAVRLIAQQAAPATATAPATASELADPGLPVPDLPSTRPDRDDA